MMTIEPGQIYVIENPSDILVEFVVVRVHPDDEKLLLAVPTDDFVLWGMNDIPIGRTGQSRPIEANRYIRCGLSAWLHRDLFKQRCFVDKLPQHVLERVRKNLAGLARGEPIEGGPDTLDPNYEDHIDELGSLMDQLADGTEETETTEAQESHVDKCPQCGELLDKGCNGLLRCPDCDGPCLCCYDGADYPIGPEIALKR